MKKLLLVIVVAAAVLAWLFTLGPGKKAMTPTAATVPSQATSQSLKPDIDAQKTPAVATSAAQGGTGPMQPGTASSQAGKPESPARAVDRLPIENNFLHGRNVRGSAVFATLKSNQFGDVMREFVRQTSRDQLAADRTNTYEHAIQQVATNANSSVQIQDFSCGLRICMGSMHSTDRSQFDAWLKGFVASTLPSKYVVTSYTVDVGGSNYEHRFLFSIDPTSNIIEPSLPNHH